MNTRTNTKNKISTLIELKRLEQINAIKNNQPNKEEQEKRILLINNYTQSILNELDILFKI